VISLAQLDMFALVVISFFLIMIGVTLTGLVLHQISKMNARLSRIEQALGCEESEEEAYRQPA
jgi:hypothetical protein